MKKIKSILTLATEVLSNVKGRQRTVAQLSCNYLDDYYGDQLCVLEARADTLN